ncbi:FKBP-type peptidyl-prolyl cis-trans isomerase [Mucilaginibacter sp.]|uniref:FKBP-type peptidyl-prolyl cis-trans isomerase n=1 Tax=Mucilaginibacter sp. TaxID=1882438 RepID=UPI002614A755|nr:FKBP-type peptidyl-prolyl cis-trans isomerase [Mucilaginibacter sp.]MDB4926685.1 peptidylprolyl isomerase [Mucilaginibacter sp.]
MKKYFVFLLVAAFATKASAQNGFQRTAKGTEYRMLTHNPGDRIKVNDVITFQVVQKTDKDSILFSTYTTGRPAQAQIQPTGDLMDIFPLLTLKDSVLIKVPTDTIFNGHEDKRPAFLPKGSNLLFLMKIIKVQSLTEAMAERDREIAEGKALIAKYQADETANTDKYIATNKLILKTTTSGLKYKINKASVKRKPLAGDTLLVNYVGRTLDGKVFDSSIAAEGAKAGLQRPADSYQPLQMVVGHDEVIPGWDEGLLLLNEGSKATFIIPSKLAYAEKGSGDIKPFSTLLFDIELVKIKPGKHVPVKATGTKSAKPVAKPPIKKAVAKKKN